MPPRRPPPTPSIFNAGTAINVLTIPILTVAVGYTAFYFTTKETLSRHEAAITTVIPQELKDEQAAREKIRGEFLAQLTKLGEGVNSLSTNVAVQGEQNKAIAQALLDIKASLAKR